MPAFQGSPQRQHQERRNDQQPVNKLPPKILSQIFVFCCRMESSGFPKRFYCRAMIPAVCRQWRRVALNTPALWSHITLSEDAPYPRLALYLSRSGSKSPLDIEIDMLDNPWCSKKQTLEELVQQVKDLFAFIISHGGAVSRWRSFSIETDIFHAHLAAMDLLRTSPMPALQHLEMAFYGPTDPEEDNKDIYLYFDTVNSASRPLFHTIPLKLRTVKLEGVPNPYLFGHPAHPQLVALTHLEIEFAENFPSLEQFHGMLTASSHELVVLSLSSDQVVEEYVDPRFGVSDGRLARTHFPKLQALSFTIGPTATWELGVLGLLEAPNLSVFRIIADSWNPQDANEHRLKMLDLLACGSDKDSPKPYFPALTHLSYETTSDSTEDLCRLLATYPGISSLSLPLATHLAALLKEPWLVPNLARLRVGEPPISELKKLAVGRHNAGIPLTTIETDTRLTPQDREQLEKYVKSIAIFSPLDYDEYEDPMDW